MMDFDRKVQERIREIAHAVSFKRPEWREWPHLSAEEFEELAGKNTGRDFDEVPNTTANPASFALKSLEGVENSVILHTSGTSGSPKYYLLSRDMLVKNWMPGMYAIFNSAGLEKGGGGTVIFVAGRREGDGVDENGNVALLSSEFSQRLALAMFDADYVISTYPNSRRLDVLSAILEMERVDVVSAPASTIARWADINLLAKGLKASLAVRSEIGEDLRRILKLTFEKAVKEIHAMLWDKIKNATFIFSFSSLTKKRWELINRFVKKKCNLYVSSEIGPFASSLCLGDNLFVFPLNIPVFREDFKPLTRTKRYYGELLVCNAERINIETGDAVILESKNPPTLYREILRMPIKVGEDRGREIYAGGYWREGCEILNSYEIRNAIAEIYDGRIFFDIRERKIIVESNAVEVERALKKARGKFRIGCEFRVAEGSFDVRAKREWWVYFVV